MPPPGMKIFHVLDVVHRHTGHVLRALQGGQHLADLDGPAAVVHVPAIGRRLGHLPRQGGGSHLSAGHAVNGVVDENDGDILIPGGGVDGLRHADGGQIAVPHQIDKKGFSLIEVVSACPTNWGMTPQKALEWVESDMLPYYPLGVYKDRSAAKEADAK